MFKDYAHVLMEGHKDWPGLSGCVDSICVDVRGLFRAQLRAKF